MIIDTKKFKEVCSTILGALDTSENIATSDSLELKAENKELQLNVANSEYFATVILPLDHEEQFRAVVNASKFLKLIAATTSESIELTVKDTYVLVKANGTNKFALITDNITGTLVKLPQIEIKNPTLNMKISGAILQSIINYNSKELLRGSVGRPVQKMFYVDQEGCITFTSGACVNSFALEKPVKVLFNQRLVKLFKLFKNDVVDFTLGYDSITPELVQTKARFKSDTITLTAVLSCNDELLNSVPVAAIRGRASATYNNNVVLDKQEFLEAINRLLIFRGKDTNTKPNGKFVCSGTSMTICDLNETSTETIAFKNDTKVAPEYVMGMDLADLKLVLDTIPEEYITLSFGDHRAAVIKRPTVSNVIPEVLLPRGA